jgi:hypothetical protein
MTIKDWMVGLGCAALVVFVAGCGSDDDDDGGGTGGTSSGGTSSGGTSSGGTSSGGTSSGGTSSGGTSSGGTGGTTGGDDCQTICDTAATLDCPNDGTVAACVTECEAGLGTCETEYDALIACTAQQPASNFECDEDGESGLVETACTAETDAFFTCFLGG